MLALAAATPAMAARSPSLSRSDARSAVTAWIDDDDDASTETIRWCHRKTRAAFLCRVELRNVEAVFQGFRVDVTETIKVTRKGNRLLLESEFTQDAVVPLPRH